MIGMTRGATGGPRWNPAIDLGAVAVGRHDRTRATEPGAIDAQVAESDVRHENSGDAGSGRDRRSTSQPPSFGGAPDPSGNAGRSLDAFA
jgi:hypothetical protein